MFYKNNNKQNLCFSSQVSFKSIRWFILFAAVLLSACVKHQYVSAPINVVQSHNEILVNDHRSEQFRQFLTRHNYSVNDWPIKKWDLDSLTLAAIYFNPSIRVAKSEIAIKSAGELVAGQRSNPTIAIPLEHHSESGDSPWLIGLVADFLFERKDKKEALLQQANAKKEAAEIRLEQQVWSIYSDLHNNFIEYFAATKQKELLSDQQNLLKENLGLLERRQELGQISEFEVSSVRLELQHVQLRISDHNYIINNSFHNLISTTGLQVDKFDRKNFSFDALENDFFLKIFDEDQLREEILNNRFDVRIKLKEYGALEAALKFEILKQYPDLNLSPGFIFDQGDLIWALGASWILPLFHNYEGQIQEALATRSHLQAEFIALQTSLINELDRKRQNYLDKLDSYENSLSLLNELNGRAEQIKKQFDLGYSDSLSVVRVQLEVERANLAVFAIKVGVLRAAEQLEKITQQPLNNSIRVKTIIQNISEDKQVIQ